MMGTSVETGQGGSMIRALNRLRGAARYFFETVGSPDESIAFGMDADGNIIAAQWSYKLMLTPVH
jgi:hypothetical protein